MAFPNPPHPEAKSKDATCSSRTPQQPARQRNSPMGMTIIEKILARASGAKKVSPGDLVVVDVDTAVFIDNAFLPASWREVLKIHDPSKIVVIFDHRAPASDRVTARSHVTARAFVQLLGL